MPEWACRTHGHLPALYPADPDLCPRHELPFLHPTGGCPPYSRAPSNFILAGSMARGLSRQLPDTIGPQDRSALERTRTSTPVRAQHPECCASTSSATRAWPRKTEMRGPCSCVLVARQPGDCSFVLERLTPSWPVAYHCRPTFLGSSMVEHAAVNRRVVGSSPTRGAIVRPNARVRRRLTRGPECIFRAILTAPGADPRFFQAAYTLSRDAPPPGGRRGSHRSLSVKDSLPVQDLAPEFLNPPDPCT